MGIAWMLCGAAILLRAPNSLEVSAPLAEFLGRPRGSPSGLAGISFIYANSVVSRTFVCISKQFVGRLAGASGIAAVVVPFNMYVDVYGIFRPAGRCGKDGLGQYLHTFRYIPENFDGVL